MELLAFGRGVSPQPEGDRRAPVNARIDEYTMYKLCRMTDSAAAGEGRRK